MTKIEWTEQTWNPLLGCSLESPGCTHCYAMTMARRLELMGVERYAGLTKVVNGKVVWTGELRQAPEQTLLEPLRRKKPTMYFVNSMSDLFHESVPDEWIDRVFAVMAICDRHKFQVLTKRSARMRAYLSDPALPTRVAAMGGRIMADGDTWISVLSRQHWPLWNVWLGVSCEDQKRADERIPDLLMTPAAVRFVSAEPLLGLVDFTRIAPLVDAHINALTGRFTSQPGTTRSAYEYLDTRLNWVIVGGESGNDARPMHPDWARSIRDQCTAAGVAFFFKQHGNWATVYDRDKDDPDWRRCPEPASDRERYVNLAGGHGFHGDRVVLMRDVGKKAAGWLLDSREWKQWPNAATRVPAGSTKESRNAPAKREAAE